MKEFKSVPVECDIVDMNEGELTDGLTIIKPLSTWELDSIYGKNEDGFIFSFRSKDDIITASAFHGICNNRLDFCAIISEFYTAFFPDTITIKETAFSDTLINKSVCYSNTYQIETYEKDSVFWTFTAVVDRDSYKIQALSYVEKGGYQKSIQESMYFMQHIVFDLKQRLIVHESID